MPYYISPPPPNLLVRIIAGIVAVFALAGAFMIGMVALLVVAGVGLFAGVVIWLRVAWLKRRMRKTGIDTHEADVSGQVIEAEYTVISERDD